MQETSTQPIQSQSLAVGEPRIQTRAARVVAVVVTWNRKDMVSGVIKALVAQTRACSALHVVVVDNNSTDGTTDHLARAFGAERIVENETKRALEPNFRDRLSIGHQINTPGFASLSIVRNAHNLGGCGGFNTGFVFVKDRFKDEETPDFVWLLDDDIDLPAEALSRLLSAAALDPEISLVGSRTVDLGDRRTTIESTIYFDSKTGLMGPEPSPNNPLAEDYRHWNEEARDEQGRPVYSGIRDVDIVSACSLLSRWSDVLEVGFWDERFFIYCDDADWCLRFRSRGKRVVCSLDAIVFHTPWTHKLTPQRGYYLNRNMGWMIEKNIRRPGLRRARLRWSAQLMSQAKSAILNRRLHEADLLLGAVSDSIAGIGGKLRESDVGLTPTIDALHQARALGGFGEVVLVCPTQAAKNAAESFRAWVMRELIAAGHSKELPRWVMLISEAAASPKHGGEPPLSGAYRPSAVVYRPRRRDKILRQIRWLRRPPRAVVVFDRTCDFPMLRGKHTLHVLDGNNEHVMIERDGAMPKLGRASRWALLGFRSVWHAWQLQPHPSHSS